MMSGSAEDAKGLAEILREIFVLSELNRPNRSKSTAADDLIGIRVCDEAGNVIETHEHVSDSKKTLEPTQSSNPIAFHPAYNERFPSSRCVSATQAVRLRNPLLRRSPDSHQFC